MVAELEAKTPEAVEVFFNRPDARWDKSRLLDEIRGAHERVVIASAWFTDKDLAAALAESVADQRWALINRADLERPGSREVFEFLGQFDCRNFTSVIPDDCWDFGLHLAVLGTDNFRDGVMHHKFVLIDRETVWCGSRNFTWQSLRNYENILRIQSAALNAAFHTEAEELMRSEAALRWREIEFPVTGGVVVTKRRWLPGQPALWNGIPVTVREVDGDQLRVMPDGGTRLLPVSSGMLQRPSKDEEPRTVPSGKMGDPYGELDSDPFEDAA